MSTYTLPSLAHTIAQSQQRDNQPAVLFNTALAAGRQRAFWARWLRRPNRLRRLEGSRATGGGYSAGLCEVELDRIRGSEGRASDFDDQFNPLSETVRQRWQRVASALENGIHLQPVVLIQVGQDYYVRDGHHRISVSRALGLATIAADVTVWGGMGQA
jgi:hypothetical protein